MISASFVFLLIFIIWLKWFSWKVSFSFVSHLVLYRPPLMQWLKLNIKVNAKELTVLSFTGIAVWSSLVTINLDLCKSSHGYLFIYFLFLILSPFPTPPVFPTPGPCVDFGGVIPSPCDGAWKLTHPNADSALSLSQAWKGSAESHRSPSTPVIAGLLSLQRKAVHEQKRAKTLSAPFSATNMLKVFFFVFFFKREKKEKKTRLCVVAVSQICYSAPWWSFKRGTGVHKKEKKNTAKGFSRSWLYFHGLSKLACFSNERPLPVYSHAELPFGEE